MAKSKTSSLRMKITIDNKEALGSLNVTKEELMLLQEMLSIINSSIQYMQLSVQSGNKPFESKDDTAANINLHKISNKPDELGISLEEQAILLSQAEKAAQEYGSSIEDSIQNVISAANRSTEKLTELGVQKDAYKNLQKQADDEIEINKSKFSSLEALQKEHSGKIKRIKQADAKFNEELARKELDNRLSLTASTFGMVGKMVSKHTFLGQMAAAVQAGYNTYEAITKALTAGPILGPVLAGVIGALGAVQIANIWATKPIIAAGYAEGGRLREGERGYIEGYHNELIAPEKTFMEIFRTELRPQIYSGATNDYSIVKDELKLLREELKYFLNNPVAPVITDKAVGKIYRNGAAMNRRSRM